MKKMMLALLLIVGCIVNAIEVKVQEQPRVLDHGLDTQLGNATIREIVYKKKGTPETADTELYVEYAKKFQRIGRLKRLERYQKAKKRIRENNAVVCPVALQQKNRDGIVKDLYVILVDTQDVKACEKFNKDYAEIVHEKVMTVIEDC